MEIPTDARFVQVLARSIKVTDTITDDDQLVTKKYVDHHQTILETRDVNVSDDLFVHGQLLVKGDTNNDNDVTISINKDEDTELNGTEPDNHVNKDGKLTMTKYTGSVGETMIELDGKTGNIDIGSATLSNGLHVLGDYSAGVGLLVHKKTSLRDTLTVTDGGIDVSGSATLRSALTVSGATTLNSGLTVNGTITTLNEGLMVTGSATLNSGLNVNGEVTLSNGLIVEDDGEFGSVFEVTGTATLNDLIVTGSAVLDKGLTVVGSTTIDHNLTVSGATTLSSLSVTAGNLGIGGITPTEKLHVEGNIKASGYYKGSVWIQDGDLRYANGETVHNEVTLATDGMVEYKFPFLLQGGTY